MMKQAHRDRTYRQNRRERIHDATRQEIKDTAWQQIAEQGAAALSLRQIAHAMGLSAPALYRYYPSRDDLVTALIQEAFTSFGEALAAARDSRLPGDHVGRYIATGIAYRTWALSYPQRYALIFGTPIPGYECPPGAAQEASGRALGVLMGVLNEAYQAGALELIPEYHDLPPSLTVAFDFFRSQTNAQVPDVVLYLTLVSWARVHGLVSLELNGQMPPADQAEVIYQIELAALGRQLGIEYPVIDIN